MMKKSGQCRTTPDSTTATSIIQGIGPQKYKRNFRSELVFFSSISFGPYCASRFVPSAWLRPSGDALNRFSTWAKGSDLRSSFASDGESGFASGDLGWSAFGFAMAALPVISLHRALCWSRPNERFSDSASCAEPTRTWTEADGIRERSVEGESESTHTGDNSGPNGWHRKSTAHGRVIRRFL